MTQDVATIQRTDVSRYDDPALVNVIKQTVAKGATDAQLAMFLQVCKRTGLDPFLKEIWYVAEKGIIMAGRDGYLRVANEHPQFDGIETRVERDDKNVPVKAVCTVWRKDRSHPTICEAFYSEYKSGSPVWTKYPSAMIGKVAEVLALKRSFAINGVVSEEEMDSTNHPAPPAHPAASVQQSHTVSSEPRAEVPEQVQKMYDHMKSIATICEVFAALKKRMSEIMGMAGDAEYYRLLKKYAGVNHANEVKSKAKARETVYLMWQSIQLAESLGVSQDDVPQEPEVQA